MESKKKATDAPPKEKLVAIETLEEDDEFEEFENEGRITMNIRKTYDACVCEKKREML